MDRDCGSSGSRGACVLVLGQSGLNKAQVAQALTAEAAAYGGSSRVRCFDFEADFLLPGEPLRDYLQMWPSLRQQAWDRAVERLAEVVRSVDESHVAIFLHGLFWFHGELFTHLNPTLLQKIEPSVVVTLVDDIDDVHTRLMDREEKFDSGASDILLPQVLTWRWAEIAIGDLIARSVCPTQGLTHHVFAVKHSAKTLFQILFRREILPIYASFPISRVRQPDRLSPSQRAELQDEINGFRRALLGEGYTVLDPVTVDEFRYDASSLSAPPHPRWPITEWTPMVRRPSAAHSSTVAQLAQPDVRQALMDEVKVQIPRRDFRLVDSSTVVAAYRPAAYDGRPSMGTMAEITYAQDIGRGAVVVHDPARDGDPFGGGGSSPFGKGVKATIVSDVDHLLRHLRMRQDRRAQMFEKTAEPQAWTLAATDGALR